ncbi:MAG TPA: bifunctional sugar-1-phosphate nucleotidylyltransferase/acetyltransferase [Candidatus Acidoferrum sp.]|nr:bifunctional sugar-1-phosphate nucleotidylyltransferase/acetyltransferase [Candidatus Acidoferrum sp.]
MKAVILAAGEGVRLQPITSTRPKHMIKIGGKTILERCIESLKTQGIDEILIVVHYMGDMIRQYFGDGQKFGVKIEYVEQKTPVGTGNAAAMAEQHLKGEFLLVYGDLMFTGEAVKNVLDQHQKEKPTATMAVIPVDKPEDYGIVELENDRYVKRIIEKPNRQEAPTNLANAGIYIFSTEIFDKIKEISASSRGEWEITDAISLMLKQEKTFLAVKLSRENWFDVGKPWDLLEANCWALARRTHTVSGLVENGAHLIGPVTVAESARLRSGAYVEGPTFIDEECDIGPNCYIRPFTSVGKKVRIGNACEIKNSVIMDGVHVGHLAYVGDSIIGEKCNLGAGTITANYRLDAGAVKMMVKDKVVNTERKKLGAVLGDKVKTGINSLLMPGVKVGTNSWIGPNVIVERDVPADTIVFLRQTVEKKQLKQ